MARFRPLACASILALCAPAAHAQADGAPHLLPPAGWRSRSTGDVHARAEQAAARLGGKVTDQATNSTGDDFTEQMALFTVPAALAPEVLEDDGAATAYGTAVAAEVLATAPERVVVERIALGRDGLAYLRIEAAAADAAARIAVVPAGPSTLLHVLWTAPDEMRLYAGASTPSIEALLEEASPPVAPFDTSRALWASWAGWFVLAGLFYGVSLATADRRNDHQQAARRTSLVLVAACVTATLALYLLLANARQALSLSGTSPGTFALLLVAPGALFCAASFVAAFLLGTRARVASAPAQGPLAAPTGLPRLYSPYAPSRTGTGDGTSPPDTASPAPVAPPGGRPPSSPVPPVDVPTEDPASLEDPHAPGTPAPPVAVPTAVVEDRTPVPQESVAGSYHVEPRKSAKARPRARAKGSPMRPISERHTPVPPSSDPKGLYRFTRPPRKKS